MCLLTTGMKRIILLLSVLITAAVSRADDSAVFGYANYHLSKSMVANRTYAGICVDTEYVSIRSGKSGLIGLPFGLVNFTLGTKIGTRAIPAIQYVVRLDQARGDNSMASIITVIQPRSAAPIKPGTPVFVVTGGSFENGTYYARIVEAKSPDAYSVRGLEEKRQAALDN